MFDFKPSSKKPECNIGGMKDVIPPKRGIFGLAPVETTMMLKLNNDLASVDLAAVGSLVDT